MKSAWIFSPLLGIILLTACRDEQPSASVPTNALAAPAGPKAQGQPQPRLRTEKLWLGTNEVTAEIAHSEKEVMTGLMWRTNMADMEGMLFVFNVPQQLGFWMKNTIMPLTCAYIAPDGVISELHDMEPHNTNAIMAASDQVQYVLEMNRDWFKRHGVSTGAVVQTSRGPLSQVFFRP